MNTKLAKAVALAMTGTALSLGAVGSASAHNMYNTFQGGLGTDGWLRGGVGNPGATVSPGWTGTGDPQGTPPGTDPGPSATLPFGYTGAGNSWLNWAAAIHHYGPTEISDANAGFDADLDTNKGSWNDNGGSKEPPDPAQGWAHNTDIGLLKADINATVTLNVTGVFDKYGVTVFEGMGSNPASHHESWNCPTCTPSTPVNSNTPFGYSGLTYLTSSDNVTSALGLSFFAKAGTVYSIFLGGNEQGSYFTPTADYSVQINAVPIPAAVWLFGSALGGLGVFGRRKTALAAA